MILPNKPDVIFLSETNFYSNKIDEIKVCFGYDACLFVDHLGLGGRLMLWNNCYSISIIGFSLFIYFFDMDVFIDDSTMWHLTGFYENS